MPKRLGEGWYRGLSVGFEGSGLFLGILFPVLFGILVVVATGFGIMHMHSCAKGPQPCKDYSYQMALLGEFIGGNEAKCDRWPAMKMSIEDRWVRADLVHCKCTEKSVPVRQ